MSLEIKIQPTEKEKRVITFSLFNIKKIASAHS
jgi:hypothetical protein